MEKMAVLRWMVTLTAKMGRKVYREVHVSMAATAVMAVMAVIQVTETRMVEAVRQELMELMDELQNK